MTGLSLDERFDISGVGSHSTGNTEWATSVAASREHYEVPGILPRKVTRGNASAEAIAHLLVGFCTVHGEWVTNLRLQRLLYYTQAWHLALQQRPLFEDDFFAWASGPIQPEVFKAFRKFGSRPIELPPPGLEASKPIMGHIEDVMGAYGHLSAFDLERLAKSEEPWITARGALDIEVVEGPLIPKRAIKAFYRWKLESGGQA